MPPKAEIKHTAADAAKLKEKEAAAKAKAKEKEAAAKLKEKEAAAKAKEKEAAAKAKAKEKEAAAKAKAKEATTKKKPKTNTELNKAVKDLDHLHQKKTESATALTEAKKLVRASTVERNQIEKQNKKLASEEKKLKLKINQLKN